MLQEQGSKIRRMEMGFVEIIQLPSMVVFWACLCVPSSQSSPAHPHHRGVEIKIEEKIKEVKMSG